MLHLPYKTHTRVLLPPCKWLDRIIYVVQQGMEHRQPHLRTWQARVDAQKPDGCTISLSSIAYASEGMEHGGESQSSLMLLAATSFPLAPRAFW